MLDAHAGEPSGFRPAPESHGTVSGQRVGYVRPYLCGPHTPGTDEGQRLRLHGAEKQPRRHRPYRSPHTN